jgi:hypothetical protein
VTPAAGEPRSAEVAELLAPRPPLGVPIPAYDGRSLPNVPASVVLALGGEPSGSSLPPLAPSLDPFAGRRTEGPVLLFVVDGLGYPRLRSSAASGSVPAWAELARPITSVFPTTTTAALTSLSTAAPPSRHGVVGYRQFLPAFGSVVDMLRLSPLGVGASDALVGPGWTPADVSGSPTIYRGPLAGAVAVSRDAFEGRGFTRLIYDGAAYRGYAGWADLAAALVDRLTSVEGPSLTVAYWDELDAVQHLRGPSDPAVDLEVGRLASLLDFVSERVGARRARTTTVLLTADHGLVATDPAAQVAVESEPTLLPLLARPPTGDRRVGFLKARAGATESLREAVERTFPPGTRVLAVDSAVDAGLFGPPPCHPELRERIGDLLVLVPSPAGITYRVPGKPTMRRVLYGAHGGLEADELVVPLVAGALERFRDDRRPGADRSGAPARKP